MFRALRYFTLLSISANFASCATPDKAPPIIDDAWRAEVYPDAYTNMREILNLRSKQENYTEGVTVITAPPFDPFFGIEIIHQIRPGPNEIWDSNEAKHWLTFSIYGGVSDKQNLGEAVKFTTTVDKYRLAITGHEYDAILQEIKNTGVLSLSENFLPEFNCYDGTAVFVDIVSENINRFEARHQCDEGFDPVRKIADIVSSFTELRIPSVSERLGAYTDND